jgi:inorganic phosphate transporter, PiT family
MTYFDSAIGPGRLVLLVLALLVVFGFEFVNGFHDTANAVATVIYTRSLRPWFAVIWSGICNFAGVSLGGIAVAMSIIKLLPVELLASSGSGAGLAMVLALLIGAILWNLGTWYFGLPASSSHTLIGAIVGVGLANSMMPGHVFGTGVNWHKVQDIGLSLIVSPVFGLTLAAGILLLARKLIPTQALHRPAEPDKKPPGWVRGILIATCSGVSFAHGSNDGQKGVGLVMLILIGILPADFAINTAMQQAKLTETVETTTQIEEIARSAYAGADAKLASNDPKAVAPESPASAVVTDLTTLRATFQRVGSLKDVPPQERWALRTKIQRVDANLAALEKAQPKALSKEQGELLKKHRAALKGTVEYAPWWVLVGVAFALGLGTMIGWKRIVVTVGEKIGKTHMSYAQGASAELVAASTIGASAYLGLPVSTTHVLSSGIAGTMVAQKSGLQGGTVRSIALAWLLTLPASMLLAAVLFAGFRAVIPDQPDKIRTAVDTTVTSHDPDVTPAVQVASTVPPLRLHGSNTIGARLAPELAEAFFLGKGGTNIARRAGDGAAAWAVSGQLAGDKGPRVIEVTAEGSGTAFADLLEKKADVGLSSRRITPEEASKLAAAGLGDLTSPAQEHVIGLDGIAVVVHPNNPLRATTLPEAARLFSGETPAWPDGGAVGVYARDERSGTYDVFRTLVLGDKALTMSAKRFAENSALADAVAADPRAVGFVPMAQVRGAKALAVGQSATGALFPSAFTVSTEDYALSRRLYLYTTTAASPFTLDFVAFAMSPEGQRVVDAEGFVNLSVRAEKGAACDARCPARYAALTSGAQRLSVNFRFQSGTTTLDTRGQADVARLTRYLADHPGGKLGLFGFSDSVGSSDANAQLSRDRAKAVETELRAHGVQATAVEGFGEAMPVASNDTPTGRDHNRRVEMWLLP